MAVPSVQRKRGLGNAVCRIDGGDAGALALGGCGLGPDPTPDYRYRLTVEIDTPEGLKTGSSVIEVDTNVGRSTMEPSGTAIRTRVRGQAAEVDLGQRGVLFALLRSKDDVDFAARIMFLLAPKGTLDGDPYLGRFANMLEMKEPIELPSTQKKINPSLAEMKGRPMLVTFTDLSDPTSVAEDDPDDLAATFGKGVRLKRITVQITDDPVTTGIEKRLAWLPNYYDKMLNGQRINTTYAESRLANDLSQGDFSKGALQ
jgi:hypothetical protein